MRILLDSNILFSAILNIDSRLAQTVFKINADPEHKVFLAEQNIAELREVVLRKKPEKASVIDRFLGRLSYTIIIDSKEQDVQIRDKTDQPILNAAIENDIDVIITGDKDFLSLDLEHPRCMTIAEFFHEYYG